MNYLFLSLVVFFISCSSHKQQTLRSKYFMDIDIYSLRGLNEVSPTEYPNIEIADSGEYRLLKYHIEKNNFIQRKYKWDEDKWILNFFEKDDTTNIYTTRIIYPTQLIEISYTDTSDYHLYDIGVLKKDTMEYFIANKTYDRKLSIWDIPLVQKQAQRKVKFWVDTSKNYVQLIKDFNQQQGFEPKIVICFPKLKRSFFWWFETQYNFSSVPCN
jgi:hypothetical protein